MLTKFREHAKCEYKTITVDKKGDAMFNCIKFDKAHAYCIKAIKYSPISTEHGNSHNHYFEFIINTHFLATPTTGLYFAFANRSAGNLKLKWYSAAIKDIEHAPSSFIFKRELKRT